MSKISHASVLSLIEVALEVESSSINENTVSEDIQSWDSLGQLNILVALDKALDGKIVHLTDMAEADTVKKIVDVLKKNSLL